MSQPQQQGIRQVYHVGTGVVAQPGHQFLQFFFLITLLPQQHRYSHFFQSFGAGRTGFLSRHMEHWFRIEHFFDKAGHVPENRKLLLQVQVDGSIENRNLIQIVRIVEDGQIQRNLDHFVSKITQCLHIFAVAQTISAVKTSSRTGYDLCDLHISISNFLFVEGSKVAIIFYMDTESLLINFKGPGNYFSCRL